MLISINWIGFHGKVAYINSKLSAEIFTTTRITFKIPISVFAFNILIFLCEVDQPTHGKVQVILRKADINALKI